MNTPIEMYEIVEKMNSTNWEREMEEERQGLMRIRM